MCLALIAVDQHPLFPLIILSNRDEFYKRTSSPADFWLENPEIYSGQDLKEHGTWLGVNLKGHFSLVTNYRNPAEHRTSMVSRGLLVKNYLLESEYLSPKEYLNKIKLNSNHYNNFNLLVGTKHHIYYYSNVANEIKKLSSGLYGLSNHLLDTSWYKVSRAKELFYNLKNELQAISDPEQVIELLFPILADKNVAPDNLLPETGVEPYLEKLLSPIFINIPEHDYGTNQSSIVLFNHKNITFSEKKYENEHVLTPKTTVIPICPQKR